MQHDPSVRSPRAFARYQALVQEANASPIVVHEDFELTEAEMSWDQLTALEARVFCIEPALLNALVLAYVRYTDMNGETDSEFDEFRDEERAAFPEFFKGERHYSLDSAVGFMITACGLPFEQALMWVCRYQVQLRRSELLHRRDPTPPAWAFGAVAKDRR